MKRLWRTGSQVRIALVVLGIVLFAVVFAGVIAPYGPTAQDIQAMLQPPSPHHLFGTDPLGRDVFSQVLFGGRISLTVGLVAVAIEAVVGTVLGVLVGYVGGWADTLFMRLTDIMLAMPGLIFALFIVAILGPGLTNVMIALGVGGIPAVARVARGATLSVSRREYIEAAIASGAGFWRIVLRHITPNILSPILVLVILDIGGFILAAAGLSFIGLGAQPPSPEWGAMLAAGRDYFPQDWWLTVFPGAVIVVVVLCVNVIGDALRDLFDPWYRGVVQRTGPAREAGA